MVSSTAMPRQMANEHALAIPSDSLIISRSARLMTTVVMTVGLGTVMTSRMPPHQNFAAMGCTTLVAALIADLLFLPALLTVFPGKASNTPDESAVHQIHTHPDDDAGPAQPADLHSRDD